MITQRTVTIALSGAMGALTIAAIAPHDAQAQALPTPKALVSGLDLECYRTPGPSLDTDVVLTHLNPVFVMLGVPQHKVTVRELEQTCVPVRKNNAMLAPAARPFIEQIDFGCYRVEAAPLDPVFQINLTHLNPVLANLPAHNDTIVRPAQLCLPIAKNGKLPPPAVLQVVQYIDLECFKTVPGQQPQFTVGLTQLNPQLAGIPPHTMTLTSSPRQLCVPVRKNAQQIPAAVRNLVQWIDLEKFAADPPVMIAPVDITVQHLNPLFADLPEVKVTLQQADSLMVPVAKNGAIPPGN